MIMLEGFSKILKTLNNSSVYSKKPPYGPPDEYPIIPDTELKKLHDSITGAAMDNTIYKYMKLIDDGLHPKTVRLPKPHHIAGNSIWSIDGSSKILDYTAFYMLLSRSALVEYEYSDEQKYLHHTIELYDSSSVCVVDGNIFSEKLALFGASTRGVRDDPEFSWIPIVNKPNEPIIVSYDPHSKDKKPSMHALAWCNKFMQTLEILAQFKLPVEKTGVLIRDGPLLPVYASAIDLERSLGFFLKNHQNKILICSSKRISESTQFLEFLLHPNSEAALDFYFTDQNVTKSTIGKLPADYLLLQKILKPGQRTPFLEIFPTNQKVILEKHPEMVPITTYYMRKRTPNTIIRLEFPKKYLEGDYREKLDFAISCVAWQHELGVKVPHVQEFADAQCQVKAEAEILRKVTASRLVNEGLETLEVYE
jgi:hypothetical protein